MCCLIAVICFSVLIHEKELLLVITVFLFYIFAQISVLKH